MVYFFLHGISLTKIGWVTFWAIFFTNSSGHPDQDRFRCYDGEMVAKIRMLYALHPLAKNTGNSLTDP
jgi:hypothetical protein